MNKPNSWISKYHKTPGINSRIMVPLKKTVQKSICATAAPKFILKKSIESFFLI